MRLTILNQFFYPDHSATSQLMTDLAENLCEHGFEVTAVAARGRYNGGDTLPASEVHNGVRIERAWATGFGKKRLWGRLADYVTFYLSACWKLLTMPRQDVVMALTTPPLIGLIALLVGRLRGMRFVALMEDLYPDVAIALGALPAEGALARLLHWLTRQMLVHADRIIVLSDCMRARVLTITGPGTEERIDVIHNWADGQAITPLNTTNCQPRYWPDLQDKFVVLFSGNLGLVNEFSTVLAAARQLRAHPDIVFVFSGEGAKAPDIRAFIQEHQLDNVRMMPYQPREALGRSLASADVLLITLADGLAGLSVPSKTYSSLATGRPLLFVGDHNSSVVDLIVKHDCGAAIASGDSEQLAAQLTAWAANKAALEPMGAAARALFERRFDRPHAVQGYLESLTTCLYGAESRPQRLRPLNSIDVEEPIS